MKTMNVEIPISDYSQFVEIEKEGMDSLLSKKYLMQSSLDCYISSPDYTNGVENLNFIEDMASSIIHDNNVSSDLSKLIHSILPENMITHDSIKSELKELDLFLFSSSVPSSEDAASLSDAFRSTSSECSCNGECCKDLIETIHDVFSGMMVHWFV